MHNPNTGLIGAHAPAGPRRFVRVSPSCKGFLQDGRFVTASDPPFAVSDFRAAELIRLGHAVAAVQVAVAGDAVMSALHPGPALAERAVAPAPRPARAAR